MVQFQPNQVHREKITVVGAGKSGQSLALLGHQLGYDVFVTERSSMPPETREQLRHYGIPWEETHTEQAFETDFFVLSSGIPPSSSVVSMAEEKNIPIMGELDFVTPRIGGSILGITGTNGKSTTVALTAHILQRLYGKKSAVAAGNIGVPLGKIALEEYACVVAELSSFQLYWSTNPCLSGGAVTNVVPDHIDWHGTFENYVEAKRQLPRLIKKDHSYPFLFRLREKHYFQNENFSRMPQPVVFSWNTEKTSCEGWEKRIIASPHRVSLYEKNKESTLFNPQKDLPLLGTHNIENGAFAAALAFLWTTQNGRKTTKDFSASMRDFTSLPHRCEELRTLKKVTFINDSKGTNVAATVTALNSLEGRDIIVLLGGQGKGESYEELVKTVQANTKHAILFGAEKERLGKALGRTTSSFSICNNLDEAFSKALDIAKEGDTILLSPACTSWDAYGSYIERGDHFKKLVERVVFNKIKDTLEVS